MKAYSTGSLLFLSTALFATLHSAHAGTFDGLSKEDQKALLDPKTNIVVHRQEVTKEEAKTNPYKWPKVTVYRIVKATPEECAAVFHDYNLQHTFIGGGKMVKSIIQGFNEKDTDDVKLAKLTANPVNVEYRLVDSIKLPWPLPNIPAVTENYTVTDTLTAANDGSYKISWSLAKGADGKVLADTLLSVDGYVQFEPLSQGSADTLIVYYNYTAPNRTFADVKLVVNKAVDGVMSGVIDIDNQVQKERDQNQALLDKQKELLHKSLENYKAE